MYTCHLLSWLRYMGWLRLVGSSRLQVSFAIEPYKRDDILQKRPIILRSLLIVATSYYAFQLNVSVPSTVMAEVYYALQRNVYVPSIHYKLKRASTQYIRPHWGRPSILVQNTTHDVHIRKATRERDL